MDLYGVASALKLKMKKSYMKLVMRPIMPKLEPLIVETKAALMAKTHRLKKYKIVNLYPLFYLQRAPYTPPLNI